MSDRVQIKPELFQWAQERSRLSMDELCKKAPKYPLWVAGEEQPTVKQLEKFAAQTYTPLGYLFLPAPPESSTGRHCWQRSLGFPGHGAARNH